MNLLSNAIKFTPIGGRIDLTVKLNTILNIGQIEVSDTGIGIKEENMNKLF